MRFIVAIVGPLWHYLTMTNTTTVTEWIAVRGSDGRVTYGIDASGNAWERATAIDGSFSFFPMGTPAPAWNPAAGRIDVLEQN
jgi:hypothetical protein